MPQSSGDERAAHGFQPASAVPAPAASGHPPGHVAPLSERPPTHDSFTLRSEATTDRPECPFWCARVEQFLVAGGRERTDPRRDARRAKPRTCPRSEGCSDPHVCRLFADWGFVAVEPAATLAGQVRPEGLEPSTRRLRVCCSNQLS